VALQAGRSIESIFAELAAAGLVRQPPAGATVECFLGSERLARLEEVPGGDVAGASASSKPKTGGKKANAALAAKAGAAAGGKGKAGGAAGAAGAAGEEKKEYPEPSLAQARQEVVASCILPLGAHEALSK